MTSIAHLSTGFLLKARFPQAPLLWLLVAAEASDIVWVALNLFHAAGQTPLEATALAQPFRYIGDLRIVEQPFSHSLVATLALAAFLAFCAHLAFRRSGARATAVALPVFLAVFGHWLLDFLVHDADLPLSPADGSHRLGPALALDPAAPWMGLSATAPLASWGVQTAVVLLSAAAFLIAFPSTARRRVLFVGAMLLFSAAALPLFIHGLGSKLFASSGALVLGTLGEIIVLTLLLQALVRRTHPSLRPVYGPLSDELAGLLRGYKLAAAALAFTLAAVYLLQAGLDGQVVPRVAVYSAVLAGAYLCLAFGLAGPGLSAWWPALFVPLLAGPLCRACLGAGRLGLLATALEALLALAALTSLHKLRTNKLMV